MDKPNNANTYFPEDKTIDNLNSKNDDKIIKIFKLLDLVIKK